ncbi:MAG TPA: hypothetical protein VF862_14415 [Gemmatimonadales bacterium]
MPSSSLAFRLLAAAVILGAGSCADDSLGPTEKPPAELNILRLPANHAPFEATSVSFWARVNQSREGRIYLLDAEGKRGEEFARLKIDSGSLLARPDGTSFGAGDSVLITMTVVDPPRVLVELQPAGLRFRSDKPAELKLDYGEADDDFDDDGDVDVDDERTEQLLAIWRQEKAGSPFVKLGSVKFEDLEEIEAKLVSFSRYAIAY